MSGKVQFTIKLNPGEREKLQEIAFSLGIVRSRGEGIGTIGSLTGLLRAIVLGEIELSDNNISIPKISLPDRFWSRVDKNGPIVHGMTTPCWIWTKFTTAPPRNYGIFTVKKGHTVKTHRLSWELTYGKIPDGLYVCHKCDNPPCCNPSHLFLGTAKDNAIDMFTKKRVIIRKGESSSLAKLTWDKVREIRFKYANRNVTQRDLAKEYNVHQSTILKIINNMTWKL